MGTIGILTHYNRSTSPGCCDGIGAVSDLMSTLLGRPIAVSVCVHWNEDETHHHSQTEAGDGHYMEVTLCLMSAVKNMSSAID